MREVKPEPVFKVVDARDRVLLETDDWVDAQKASIDMHNHSRLAYVRGTHPTHEWGDPHPGQNPRHYRRCKKCDGWDNGSYGSQAPCGYDWHGEGGSSLVAAIERELAARNQ